MQDSKDFYPNLLENLNCDLKFWEGFVVFNPVFNFTLQALFSYLAAHWLCLFFGYVR